MTDTALDKAADAIITSLPDAGVEKVFGVAGTSPLDLIDAVAREPRLEFVSAREEEAAAHMADGYARASGRVGVVLAHLGPGALRLMCGVGTACKDSVPLLVLTGNEILSFPGLLGALEADPQRRAVAIVGDGCLSMCLGEFETAARRGTKLTVVVCNDARFPSQQSHQHRRFEGRVVGTDFTPIDFVAIAAAQGVKGWTATDDKSARDAIREAMAHNGRSVIDARIDPAVQPATGIEGSGDQRIVANG